MSGLPNPNVYLNHLTPEQAKEFEATRNLSLAVLGATIWDILIYIPEDLKILKQAPLYLVTFCFFVSRISALIFILLSVIQQTHALENCSAMLIAIGVMIVIATSSTAFLFLQRLRAVYRDNRWVQASFFLLWLATSGSMTVVLYSQQWAHIPGTHYCVYSHVEQYMSVGGFMSGFFDTAVFVAISYKIASTHSSIDAGISWDTLVSGKALPRISRSILQGGQQYYLITTCLNLALGILIVIPQTPPIYKLTLTFPFVPVTASMACRVFRNIRTRVIVRENGRFVLSDVNFASPPDVSEKSLPERPKTAQVDMGYHMHSSRSTLPSGLSPTTLQVEDERSIPHEISIKRSSFSEVAPPSRAFVR